MYEQAGIPPTADCMGCTWKRLLGFWILGRFRVTKSALSGKQIITMLPESVKFPIYEHEEFLSDAWDPLSYGQDYDPNRPFLEQLTELQHKVPHPHQLGRLNTACEWTDDWWESKDSYLCRSGYRNETVSYGYRISTAKECIDCAYCFDIEQSYDCLYCYKGWRLKYCFNTHDSVESAFLYDCRNCNNCFMSWNLRNKRYCILNQQYTKEEYFEKLKQYNLRSFSAVQKLKEEFWGHLRDEAVHRENLNTQVTACRGNFMTENKNCTNCSFVEKSENCRQLIRGYEAKDSIEVVSCGLTERSTRTLLDQWSYGNSCVMYVTNCRYSMYLDSCEECQDCFGSVGLRKKKHCILNKQYTKEEYEKLRERIKQDMVKRGEWGKFFPFEMAYGPFNMSLARWSFPHMGKKEAEAMGARWEETPIPSYENAIASDKLPDLIDDVKDEITKQRLICVESKLSYNIAPHELAFYRQHGIPLPQKHFDQRTFERFRPMCLMFMPQHGICYYCKKEIEHYYDPELGFKKISCTPCYQQNIS